MEFIFTCNYKHAKLTEYEFSKYDSSFNFIKWLDDGVGLAMTRLSGEELYGLITKSPIIYVRHVFAVYTKLSYNEYADIAVKCADIIPTGSTFTVQTTYSKTAPRLQYNLTETVSNRLCSEYGYNLDIKDGEYIVSVYADSDALYVGVNKAKYNLSHYKSGMPHYSPTEEHGFISRAEYKLIEIIESFNIDFTSMKTAADLGAAPGGWTKVLLEKGLTVSAIDPCSMHPTLEKNSRVNVYKMYTEKYLLLKISESFDIIVNDMKMDVHDSVMIINSFYSRLNDDGIVIITFKLPNVFSYNRDIIKNINAFRGFQLIGARQFFHNRSEITVVLKKSQDPEYMINLSHLRA